MTGFRLVTSDLNLMELSHSLIRCYPYPPALTAFPFVIYLAEPTDATEPSQLIGTSVDRKATHAFIAIDVHATEMRATRIL